MRLSHVLMDILENVTDKGTLNEWHLLVHIPDFVTNPGHRYRASKWHRGKRKVIQWLDSQSVSVLDPVLKHVFTKRHSSCAFLHAVHSSIHQQAVDTVTAVLQMCSFFQYTVLHQGIQCSTGSEVAGGTSPGRLLCYFHYHWQANTCYYSSRMLLYSREPSITTYSLITLILFDVLCKKRYSSLGIGDWGSQIFRQSAHEGGKVVSPTHQPPLSLRKYSWYSFLLEAGSNPEP